MKKRIFFIGVVVLLFLLGGGLLLYKQKIAKISQSLYYDTTAQSWKPIAIDTSFDRDEAVKGEDNSDGFHNLTLLRGYFESYDQEKKILRIKALIRFTQGGAYENLDLVLPLNQTIYCVPEKYTDSYTNVVYDTKQMTIPVKNGGTIYLSTERLIDFNDFLNQGNSTTYLFIQLTKDFNRQNTNYIQKIIAVGLCN